MRSFSLDREILAPPATVFEVLTDHRGYVAITPLRSAELEREGEPPPNGVGAIRVLKALGQPIREEVVEYQPNERFADLRALPDRGDSHRATGRPGGGRHREALGGEPAARSHARSAAKGGRGERVSGLVGTRPAGAITHRTSRTYGRAGTPGRSLAW
jgi:Polyketide cyclase / dehydrase and lipid transport